MRAGTKRQIRNTSANVMKDGQFISIITLQPVLPTHFRGKCWLLVAGLPVEICHVDFWAEAAS